MLRFRILFSKKLYPECKTFSLSLGLEASTFIV